MLKIFRIAFLFLVFALPFLFKPVLAETKAEDKVLIEVFKHDKCVYCRAEIAYLSELMRKRDDFRVVYYDVTDPEEGELFLEVMKLEKQQIATPATYVGNKLLVGFGGEYTTGKVIENLIDLSKGKKTLTVREFVAAGGSKKVAAVDSLSACDPKKEDCEKKAENLLKVPFFGVIDTSTYPLVSLSLILGLIDGFNPCAMWVLVTFLLLLLQAGSRKKMVFVAGAFILAEAVIYYAILNLWLGTWNFVKYDLIVTPLVGVIAILGGLFFLYEFYKNDGTCKVTTSEKKLSTMSRIKKLVSSEMKIATFLGIFLLAFSVNIIEFACSIGIPQAFTKILDLNNFSFLGRQIYILLYMLTYMLDDLLVFALAIYGIQKMHLTTKYVRWSNLLGGILMLIIGIVLIVKPELLVFF